MDHNFIENIYHKITNIINRVPRNNCVDVMAKTSMNCVAEMPTGVSMS